MQVVDGNSPKPIDQEDYDLGIMISKRLVEANKGTITSFAQADKSGFKIMFTMQAKNMEAVKGANNLI